MTDSNVRRTAVVTGGSRGIGRATCLALASMGAAVAVHYRAQEAAAAAVVAQIQAGGGAAAAFQADMADGQSIAGMFDRIVKHFGNVAILINNAGEMTDGPAAEMNDEMWEHTLTVNLTAAFRCARAVIPAMQAQRWGRIINVSSQAVYTGSANHAHYAASKSGLLGLTFSLAKELGSSGITVNLVAPGRITTDMLLERSAGREEDWLKQTPLRRFGQPQEVAAAIAFLASESASYITGANLHVNGGLVMG